MYKAEEYVPNIRLKYKNLEEALAKADEWHNKLCELLNIGHEMLRLIPELEAEINRSPCNSATGLDDDDSNN